MKRLALLLCLFTTLAYGQAVQTLQYGIYVPRGVWSAADSSKHIFQDTTLSVNASGRRVIAGSLLDPKFCWDYAAFRAQEKNTSWYNELGSFPTYWAITAAAAIGDSVVVWDILKSSRYCVFVAGATAMLEDATPVVTDLNFLDGILYISGTGGADITAIDFLRDRAYQYSTTGISEYQGTITQRNGTQGWLTLNAAPAIVNNSVNAISAIRDPGGLPMKDGSGRLAQWWSTAEGSTNSGRQDIYNPYANTILSSSLTTNFIWTSLLPGGSLLAIDKDITRYYLEWIYSGITNTVSYVASRTWKNSASLSEKLAWGNAAIISRLATIPGLSAAGNNSPLAIASADSGLLVLHSFASKNDTTGAVQLIESTFNSGYMKGAVGAAYPLESGGTDISPNAYNLTTIAGTHTYVTGVIGKADSIAGATAGWLVADKANLRVAAGDWAYSCWFKSINATNPAGNQLLMSSAPAAGAIPAMKLYLTVTNGYLTGDAISTATNTIAPATDVYDGNWHFVVWTRAGSTEYLYTDGEQSGSVAVTHATVNNDSLTIGALYDGSLPFTGVIDNPIITAGVAMTAAEVRYMYSQGLSGKQSTVSACDCLPVRTDSTGYVQADASGMFVAGNQDSFTVFDRYGIPQKRYGSPGRLIKDVAFLNYGADSLGIVVVTTTRVQTILPDVRAVDLATYQWPFNQPLIGERVVVDSSGVNGLFWTGDDAVDAAANMGRGNIFIRNGTYPPFDADQAAQIIEGESWLNTKIEGSTVDDAIDVSAARITIRNLNVRTTPAGGNPYDGIDATSAAQICLFDHIYSAGSDAQSILLGGAYSNVTNGYFLSADNNNVDVNADQCRVVNNQMNEGVQLEAAGDHFTVAGNVFSGNVNGTVNIMAGSVSGVVAGNSIDGTIVDGGTSNITANLNVIY